MKVSINNINLQSFKSSDEKILSEMVEHSKEIMEECVNLFKSKTLDRLYTADYKYSGALPNSTYIIDKQTGKRKLIFVSQNKQTFNNEKNSVKEIYTAKTYGLKNLGEKYFSIVADENKKNAIKYGEMQSFANDRYSGTQIRLTQLEVERAMQLGIDKIPLYALAKALPFHTMMGFRPVEAFYEVKNVPDVTRCMDSVYKFCPQVRKEHFTPIIHSKENKYYFDCNQTVANAVLRQLKEIEDTGIKRNFSRTFEACSVKMELSGTELEMWKQRALSQPILLDKHKL